MALYDFLCDQCGHQFEQTASFEERTVECPHECGFSATRLPPLIGGYTGNMGGASTRPKNSTAMKKATVFTGNAEEPEQLEMDFTKKD
jgi:putative FmdB family regulatory protein